MEGAIVGLLCALVFGLFLGTLIGGVILRAACALYNKLAGAKPPKRGSVPDWEEPPLRRPEKGEVGEGITGSPQPFDYREAREEEDLEQRIRASQGVPEPELGTAMLIAFVSLLVNTAVNFGIRFTLSGGQAAFGGADLTAQIIASLISIPIGILVLGGMASAMLPTTFGKGMLVALLYLAIAFAIALVIGGCAAGVMVALGGGRGRF